MQKKQLKALIIDGENNHGIWPKTTAMMKSYLEDSGLFTVDVNRTKYTWQGPHYDKSIGIEPITDLLAQYPIEGVGPSEPVEEPVKDPDFKPSFSDYDVVITNMGWKASDWSEEMKESFEHYIQNGGGLIVIHAANNSWGNWPAYNRMIGLGGWGGRSQESGPYVYYDNDGQLHRNTGEGNCGSHGPQHEFVLTTRASDHPIMKDLPTEWLHTKDELYDRLRGPAENMTVLATAYSDVDGNGPPWNKKVKGTGRHEPMLMAVEYGKGRIFHSALGHMDYSMECVGFITTFLRATEWASTGQVTQAVPTDFPTKTQTSIRKFTK
jgi:type 1 glutamine amidotransferase